MKLFVCFLMADLRQKNLLFWDWIFPFLLMIGASFFVGESGGNTLILSGLLAFLVLQSLIFGIPYRVSEFSEKGTLQLIAEEGNLAKFLFGFLSTRILMTVLQCLLFLGVGAAIMQVNLNVNWLAFVATLFSGIAILSGIALLISTLVKSQQAALGFSQLIYIVLSLTSGIFYPLEKSPKLLQKVSVASPLTYLKSLFDRSITGNGVDQMTCLILVLLGLLCFVLGIYLLNKRLNRRQSVATL